MRLGYNLCKWDISQKNKSTLDGKVTGKEKRIEVFKLTKTTLSQMNMIVLGNFKLVYHIWIKETRYIINL